MNTNSNLYTILYSTVIVTLVAAVLAFASTSLKPLQEANEKAETIGQMLAAAHFEEKEVLNGLSNDEILGRYADCIREAFTVNAEGVRTGELNTGKEDLGRIELVSNLKAENDHLRKNPGKLRLPVYLFSQEGRTLTVIPVYGAGLWGPVWGYLAFEDDLRTLHGAYFDHATETPGLGAKIKDDPAFRAEFDGKTVNFQAERPFSIVKGGAPEGDESAVDAITGASMTCKGLDAAIRIWIEAYKPYFTKALAGAASGQPAEDIDRQALEAADGGTAEDIDRQASEKAEGGTAEDIDRQASEKADGGTAADGNGGTAISGTAAQSTTEEE